MSASAFALHPRLAADCHHLGRFSASHLLLHGNALIPWFILVPETDLTSLLDLPEPLRCNVMDECKRVADYLTGVMACPRVNVASIGNLVPQLHVHVVGRKPGDACWPQPVWGHLHTSEAYTTDALKEFIADLSTRTGLAPGI